MLKVLTAYGDKHAGLVLRLTNSLPEGVQHVVKYDNGNGKAWAMDRMFEEIDPFDICALIDADDIATEDTFSKERLEALEAYDVVYGDCINRNDKKASAYWSREFDADLLMSKNYIPYSSVITRGWVLKGMQYPEQNHVGDWIFWNKLIAFGRTFKYVPGIACIRDETTSYYTSRIPVYRKIVRLIRNNNAKKLIKLIRDI